MHRRRILTWIQISNLSPMMHIRQWTDYKRILEDWRKNLNISLYRRRRRERRAVEGSRERVRVGRSRVRKVGRKSHISIHNMIPLGPVSYLPGREVDTSTSHQCWRDLRVVWNLWRVESSWILWYPIVLIWPLHKAHILLLMLRWLPSNLVISRQLNSLIKSIHQEVHQVLIINHYSTLSRKAWRLPREGNLLNIYRVIHIKPNHRRRAINLSQSHQLSTYKSLRMDPRDSPLATTEQRSLHNQIKINSSHSKNLPVMTRARAGPSNNWFPLISRILPWELSHHSRHSKPSNPWMRWIFQNMGVLVSEEAVYAWAVMIHRRSLERKEYQDWILDNSKIWKCSLVLSQQGLKGSTKSFIKFYRIRTNSYRRS